MPPGKRDQDAEWEKEHNIAPRVPHAERSRRRATRQVRGRTDQRCQTGTQVKSHRSLGTEARTMAGGERSGGKAREINDEGQEQDFAVERQAVLWSPTAVQPKNQPARNGERHQGQKRRGKT